MVRGSILLLMFIALLGCQPDPDSVRVGSNRWLGYAPFYLADELQWTAPSGVRLVEYPTTTGVLRGFRNGMLDAAMLTLDETLLLQASADLNLEIILITNVSAGADVLFARAPIATVDDLRGRRIGVENTALGAYFLSRVLDQAQLDIADLQVVSLPVHEQVEAYAAGRVDAVITFASEGPALEASGARRTSTAANCRVRSSTFWSLIASGSILSSASASERSGSTPCAPGRISAPRPTRTCLHAWA